MPCIQRAFADMANIQSAWYENRSDQFFFKQRGQARCFRCCSPCPIGILAGCAFSRFEIPPQLITTGHIAVRVHGADHHLVVPFYLIAVWLNIYNAHGPCAGAFPPMAIPFATWVMIGYFEQLAQEKWSISPPSMARIG